MPTPFNPTAANLTGSDTGHQNPVDALGKQYQVANFQYPLNLGAPNAGLDHYVLFFINETSRTQYPAKYTGPRPTSIPVKYQSQLSDISNNAADAQAAVQKAGQAQASGKNWSDLTPITRIPTAIALYMPPDYKTQYATNWEVENLGAAEGINTGLTNDWIAGLIKTGGILGGEAAKNFGKYLNDKTDANITGAIGLQRRQAINPHAAVLFTGIGFRDFQFAFKLMPQSEAEANNIYNIVQAFKFYAAPELQGGFFSRFWIYPAEFDIMFVANGQENLLLPKISTCCLKNIAVNYAGDQRWAAFRNHSTKQGAPPLVVTLALTFTELEVMTKKRILEGY